MREVFSLPLIFIQNREGDSLVLDDDETGRGENCKIVLELWGACGPVRRPSARPGDDQPLLKGLDEVLR